MFFVLITATVVAILYVFESIGVCFVIGFLVYVISIPILEVIVDYFIGWRKAKTIRKVYAFPLSAVVFIWDTAQKIMTLPWRYRTRRLFRERFEQALGGDYTFNWSMWNDSPQEQIERLLSHLAAEMEMAFKEQELARSSGDLRWNTLCDEEAKRAKDLFWRAHSFFSQENFSVKEFFLDYLSESELTTHE